MEYNVRCAPMPTAPCRKDATASCLHGDPAERSRIRYPRVSIPSDAYKSRYYAGMQIRLMMLSSVVWW